MSVEKWESVTWDWVEREIVDYILIASEKPDKAKSFLNRLAKAPESASLPPKPAATPQRSSSHA